MGLFECKYCGHFHSNFAEAFDSVYGTAFIELYPKKCYHCKKAYPLATSIEKFIEMRIKTLDKYIEESFNMKSNINLERINSFKGFLAQIIEQLS